MRDWLNSILGQEGGRVAQFGLALLAVILLILLLAWVWRRMQPGARLVAVTGGKSRKRLGVLEASDVDTRRRLVLVRRDDVEHLIMIGGPNDLLIESRILRAGHAAAARPNIQHMPRPAVTAEPERVTGPTGGSAPTRQPVTGPTTLTSRSAPQIPEPEIVQVPLPPASRFTPEEEPELPLPVAPVQAPSPTASAAFTPGVAPPPSPPASRPHMTPVAPAAPAQAAAPESRRPSLSDLLTAATAAKANNSPADFQQPVTAPPPLPRTRQPQPDLEEDDRDMPTQIISRRPPQPEPRPQFQPQPQVVETITTVELDEPLPSRETEVATQIERALADLNPMLVPQEAPAPVEPAAQPQMTQPQVRRPALEPAQPPIANQMTRPVPAQAPTAAPTMPPIPLRPTPPSRTVAPERATERPSLQDRPPVFERPPLADRPPLPERPSIAERPALADRPPLQPDRPTIAARPALTERPPLAERPPIAERPVLAERPPLPERTETGFAPTPRSDDRATTGQPATFTPVLVEPATAPRPITAPAPRPPAVVATETLPPPAQVPQKSASQKTDELEEEMAKLLSELGGSSPR